MSTRRKPDPKAPTWLFVRDGVKGDVYSIDFRKSGKPRVRTVIEGTFATWRAAAREGEKILDRTFHQSKPKPVALVRCEDLCNEIILLKRSKSRATYEQTEIFFRKHIIPYLNERCPYASELNSTVWDNYKNFKRLENPEVALFNHWKFFVMLYKYCHEKGVLPNRLKLAFDEEREDFREDGKIIPDSELERIIAHASPMWRDRIVIGRYTGMRPGEVRRLRKDRVNFHDWIVSLKKEDTKTRTARSFVVESEQVQEALLRRYRAMEGEYFFPHGNDRARPLDKSLKGWHAALSRAKISTHYTPHDLRHTYLTEMFKTSENPALICFQAGLSLEEATATYLHFTAEDTRSIARRAALMLQRRIAG